MNIIEMKTEEIIPYINNPRRNDDAVDYVAASIQEFGFKVPIVVDKDNVVVTGHTRLKAAKKLGLDTVPVIKADDLTDAQIKAFRLADNKVSEFTEWDTDKLEIELEGLEGFNMDGFGFEFDALLDDSETPSDQGIRDSEELSLDDFDDDKFEHTCPRCGFAFNDNKGD